MTLPGPDLGEMTSVLGKFIVDIRSNTAVHALVGDRVYGRTPPEGEPAYQAPYVLVRRLGPIRRFPRAPYYTGRLLVDCVGRADVATGTKEATDLYNAVSTALHAKGWRQSPAGATVASSYEELGGQAIEDPDTRQPVERSIYIYSAPTAQAD